MLKMTLRVLFGGCLLMWGAVVQAGILPELGTLVYRVYVSDSSRAVALPTLVFNYSDGRPSVTVRPCEKTSPLLSVIELLVGYAPDVPACAWQMVVNDSEYLSNIAFPDTHATYWATPFQLDPALSIKVLGTFPDARYMSFNVYNSANASYQVNGRTSGLPDYLIAPDVGSANPWQKHTSAGGRYTITLTSVAKVGVPNVVPLPDPKVKVTSGRIPFPCEASECPPDNKFFRPSVVGGFFPNVDSVYVAALTHPVPGQVLVVRGKMPTVPTGIYSQQPMPWPGTTQLRYWSLCNNLYKIPYPVVANLNDGRSIDKGCVADLHTPLDNERYYTIVVSAPDDRPHNAIAAKGIAWLPNSIDAPQARHILLIRNTMPIKFDEAAQNVPADDNYVSASRVMKDYYPVIYQCSNRQFDEGGWQGCAAADRARRERH